MQGRYEPMRLPAEAPLVSLVSLVTVLVAVMVVPTIPILAVAGRSAVAVGGAPAVLLLVPRRVRLGVRVERVAHRVERVANTAERAHRAERGGGQHECQARSPHRAPAGLDAAGDRTLDAAIEHGP